MQEKSETPIIFDIDSKRADEILNKHDRVGAWLLRKSSQTGSLTVTMKAEDRIAHYRYTYKDGAWLSFLPSDTPEFRDKIDGSAMSDKVAVGALGTKIKATSYPHRRLFLDAERRCAPNQETPPSDQDFFNFDCDDNVKRYLARKSDSAWLINQCHDSDMVRVWAKNPHNRADFIYQDFQLKSGIWRCVPFDHKDEKVETNTDYSTECIEALVHKVLTKGIPWDYKRLKFDENYFLIPSCEDAICVETEVVENYVLLNFYTENHSSSETCSDSEESSESHSDSQQQDAETVVISELSLWKSEKTCLYSEVHALLESSVSDPSL